jgi:hypothetical protein
LRSHVSGIHNSSDLEHAVCQRGLAVVDMGNNAEITNNFGVCGTRRWGVNCLRHSLIIPHLGTI